MGRVIRSELSLLSVTLLLLLPFAAPPPPLFPASSPFPAKTRRTNATTFAFVLRAAQRRGRGTVFKAHTCKRKGPCKIRKLDYAEKHGYIKGVVKDIVHDSGRGAPVAVVHFRDPYRYKIIKERIVASEGMYTGQFVYCGKKGALDACPFYVRCTHRLSLVLELLPPLRPTLTNYINPSPFFFSVPRLAFPVNSQAHLWQHSTPGVNARRYCGVQPRSQNW